MSIAANRLQAEKNTDKAIVEAFFASITGKATFTGKEIDLIIDFRKIVPVDENCGVEELQSVCMKAWGTSGIYVNMQKRIDEYTIFFVTEDNGVPELILELSRQHPEITINYMCDLKIDENNRSPVGEFVFCNGTCIADSRLNIPDDEHIGGSDYERVFYALRESSRAMERDMLQAAEEKRLKNRTRLLNGDDPLKFDIEDFDFSVRSYNCMKRAGINSIADIIALTREELMQVRNFNEKNLNEVVDKLHTFGLNLKE